MAFDGRPDPNKGNDEKSPCTLHYEFKLAIVLSTLSCDKLIELLFELTL